MTRSEGPPDATTDPEDAEAEPERGGDELPAGGKPRERVLWNTVAIIIARVLGDAFHVLAAIKLARHLGERMWGMFGYLLSSMEVFRVLANFGLDIVTVRTMALGRRHPRDITRHLLALKSGLGGIVFILILLSSLVIQRFGENIFPLLVLGAGILPVSYNASLQVRYQAEHLMDRLIPVQFVAGGLYLAGIYAGAAAGLGLDGLICIFVGYSTLLFGLTAAMTRRVWPAGSDGNSEGGLNRSMAWEIFRDGLPVGALGLIVVLYSRLGIFLLEHYGDLNTVGHYFIAIKVSEPLLTIASALSTSAFPVLSRLVERGEYKTLGWRFFNYSWRSALLSGVVALVVTLFAGQILGLVKEEYVSASNALIALSWATVFMFQNQLSTAVINSFGKYHYVTVFACFNLVVFLTLSLLLIPRYGATGGGLSTLGTEGINTLVQLVTVTVLIKRQTKMIN